jgi:chromosome partitioning protein
MAKRVSIINFKGGVGKTTLAFHLATGLARYYDGTRVLLIDVDHQSSLSILCLGNLQQVADCNWGWPNY